MPAKVEHMTYRSKITDKWVKGLISCVLAIFTIIVFYYETINSLIFIWSNSETFAHGFIIAPISIWLIWDKKEQLLPLIPTPAFLPLIAIFIAGIGWSLANATSIILIQQLSVVAIIIFSIWTILGHQIARVIIFPLFFLFFCVPMGEEFIPTMMEFTADFTVKLLQITGIPVYREELYFSLPTGNWSVVKACSGIRYLIASLTLGTVYAYLTYYTQYKRLLFILAAIVVPVIANGIRAYAIVMIGHLSDMELATGVDHLIYGWVFFGFLMAILFGLGSIWRESKDMPIAVPRAQLEFTGEARLLVYFMPGIIAIALIMAWPSYTYLQNERIKDTPLTLLTLPDRMANWEIIENDTPPWSIDYQGYDQLLSAQYENRNGDNVFLSIVFYGTQKQGSELINSSNKTINKNKNFWKASQEKNRELNKAVNIEVKEKILRSNSKQMLIWHLNWIDGTQTVNNYYGKYLEAKSKILTGRSSAAAVFFSTEIDSDQVGRGLLEQFFLDTDKAINQILIKASE